MIQPFEDKVDFSFYVQIADISVSLTFTICFG